MTPYPCGFASGDPVCFNSLLWGGNHDGGNIGPTNRANNRYRRIGFSTISFSGRFFGWYRQCRPWHGRRQILPYEDQSGGGGNRCNAAQRNCSDSHADARIRCFGNFSRRISSEVGQRRRVQTGNNRSNEGIAAQSIFRSFSLSQCVMRLSGCRVDQTERTILIRLSINQRLRRLSPLSNFPHIKLWLSQYRSLSLSLILYEIRSRNHHVKSRVPL
jgi:hypothetical protein